MPNWEIATKEAFSLLQLMPDYTATACVSQCVCGNGGGEIKRGFGRRRRRKWSWNFLLLLWKERPGV